jgi:hypothetical protein
VQDKKAADLFVKKYNSATLLFLTQILVMKNKNHSDS